LETRRCFIAVAFQLYFIIVYAIRRVQVSQDGLKLNGTLQLLVYADDVSVLGRATIRPHFSGRVLIFKA
jgi:hypothetical protein